MVKLSDHGKNILPLLFHLTVFFFSCMSKATFSLCLFCVKDSFTHFSAPVHHSSLATTTNQLIVDKTHRQHPPFKRFLNPVDSLSFDGNKKKLTTDQSLL